MATDSKLEVESCVSVDAKPSANAELSLGGGDQAAVEPLSNASAELADASAMFQDSGDKPIQLQAKKGMCRRRGEIKSKPNRLFEEMAKEDVYDDCFRPAAISDESEMAITAGGVESIDEDAKDVVIDDPLVPPSYTPERYEKILKARTEAQAALLRLKNNGG